MSYKPRFSRQKVIESSIRLIKAKGWEQFTVRNIAALMQGSTQPVYSLFGSMAELKRAVMVEILERLMVYMRADYGNDALLNIGIGYLTFAAEEAELFRVLLNRDFVASDIGLEYNRRVTGLMIQASEQVGEEQNIHPDSTEEQFERAIYKLRVFTHGLACMVSVRGKGEDWPNIIRLIGEGFDDFFGKYISR